MWTVGSRMERVSRKGGTPQTNFVWTQKTPYVWNNVEITRKQICNGPFVPLRNKLIRKGRGKGDEKIG